MADGIDVTRAEFEYAVTHEGALTVDDILDRRTRIGLVAEDRARACAVAEEFVAGSSCADFQQRMPQCRCRASTATCAILGRGAQVGRPSKTS